MKQPKTQPVKDRLIPALRDVDDMSYEEIEAEYSSHGYSLSADRARVEERLTEAMRHKRAPGEQPRTLRVIVGGPMAHAMVEAATLLGSAVEFVAAPNRESLVAALSPSRPAAASLVVGFEADGAPQAGALLQVSRSLKPEIPALLITSTGPFLRHAPLFAMRDGSFAPRVEMLVVEERTSNTGRQLAELLPVSMQVQATTARTARKLELTPFSIIVALDVNAEVAAELRCRAPHAIVVSAYRREALIGFASLAFAPRSIVTRVLAPDGVA